MSARITIRADGGMTIGSGHLFRMAALAESLREKGAAVTLVTSAEIPAHLILLYREAGAEIVVLPPETEIGATADITTVAAIPADWICLDGHHFSRSYRDELRRLSSAKIFWVDDVNASDAGAEDAIFNQNFYAQPDRYPQSAATLLLGPRYALMRKQFRECPRRAEPLTGGFSVLITLGWTAPIEYLRRAIRAIATARELTSTDIRARVLVGGQTDAVQAIDSEINSLKLGEYVKIEEPVKEMAQFLQGFDFAISAAGTTLFELAFSGVPAVTFPIVENQLEAAPAYAAAGLGLAVKFDDVLTTDGLGLSLSSLVWDALESRQFANNGRELVDGLGAQRVAQFLTES